ncbi:DUF1801 domain-containing protein [Tropicibacter oceani]|uniref:DUF1801 domain-containing protein n=1 Tax=Tropicibacter oceani TaxID=3058420 RepID=A0ABY8QLI5_9RHOB|nr:DUF1801 domain-containing protein [Tropicibacter oceani]WGW04803.1 DUF1801 domain-containing protein [Tropicibacter oceani]
MTDSRSIPASVAPAFEAFPERERSALLAIRSRILSLAAEDPRIGPLHESLKWGQPSYASKVGTPLRLGLPKSGGVAIFCHCQTRVIADHRALFGTAFRYDGNRALLIDPDSPPDPQALDALIRSALTYRLKKENG